LETFAREQGLSYSSLFLFFSGRHLSTHCFKYPLHHNVGWSVGISPFTVRQSVDVVSKLVAVSPVDKKVLPTDYPFIDRQSDGENSQTDSVLLFMPTDHVMLYICLPIDSPTGILKLIKKIKSNVAESLHIKYAFD